MRDFRIHLITDRERVWGELLPAVCAALRGGVGWVQAREKSGSARELYETAVRLLPHARKHGAGVLVNDRVDVALAVGADGVHLPAGGLPPRAARELAGERLLIGVSVHSLDEARRAVADGADYVTFGHVYPTASKPGLPPRGVRELAEIVGALDAPVLAVGGIDRSNILEVLGTGASGVAMISALLESPEPETMVRKLRAVIEGSELEPEWPFYRPREKGER